MMGTVAITVICTIAYLGVSLLCPSGRRETKTPKEEHTARHAGTPTLEEQFTELFIDAWLKGEEQWVKYAWIQPTEMTVSW